MPVIGQPESVRDFITDAGVLCNAIGAGETLNPEEVDMGFFVLNALLDEWDTELVNLFSVVETDLVLLSLKPQYNLGPTGVDFTQPRPSRIDAGSILVGPFKFPLKMATFQEWNQLVEPARTAARPEIAYCDYGFPNLNISFSPIPNLSFGATIARMYFWNALAQYTSLDTAVLLPPGYNKALKHSLAVNMAPRLGATPNQLVIDIALGAKAAVRALNAQNFGIPMAPPPAPAPPQQQ